jgi:hypothetical protein
LIFNTCRFLFLPYSPNLDTFGHKIPVTYIVHKK